MENLSKYLAVALGGALGAITRFAINNLLPANYFAPFPLATFLINVSGSFAIGFLITLATQKFEINENWRLFFSVGFLGAYTTFSTFEFETLQMIREKYLWSALMYVVLSVVVGFFGVVAGAWLAEKI